MVVSLFVFFYLLWPCDNLVLDQTAINWIWIELRLTGSGSNCNKVDLDKTVINCQLVQGAPPLPPTTPSAGENECMDNVLTSGHLLYCKPTCYF